MNLAVPEMCTPMSAMVADGARNCERAVPYDDAEQTGGAGMPLERLALIIVVVVAGAGATVWLGALAAAAWQVPFVWLALLPAAVAAYVLWRVIADRVVSAEDDHYDKIRK